MTMGKFISNLFLSALAIGLSIFTASRTLNLLAWALPTGQDFLQYLGLAAFEGGMYFWSFYFVAGAKGVQQRSIALCMAVGSVIAVCIATVADLYLDASLDGKLPTISNDAKQSMILFLGIVITINVAAFLACKLMAPEKLREIRTGQAEDQIFAEGLRAIEALTPSMAADAAPYLAADWSNRTWNKIVPGVQRNTLYLGPTSSGAPALPAPVTEPLSLQSPVSTPVLTPAPVRSTPAPMANKPRKLLGFIPLSEKKRESSPVNQGKMVEATLAQEATIKAPAPVSAPEPTDVGAAVAEAHLKLIRAQRMTASRRAHRSARVHRPASAPAPKAASVPPSPESEVKASASAVKAAETRVCSECSQSFEVKNAKQLTCSKTCRAKRSRRLSKEKKA